MPTTDEILGAIPAQEPASTELTTDAILNADPSGQDRAGLQAVIQSASQEDPERKARVTKWADQLGIPPDVVDRNEAYFTGQKRFISDVNPEDIQTIAATQPRLYAIMQDRENAVMMSDDLKSMTTLQSALDYLTPRADPRPKLPWLEGAVSAARQAQLTTSSLFWAIPSAVAADFAGPDNAFTKQFFYDNWDYLQAEREAQGSFQEPGFVQSGVNALVGSVSDPSNLMPAFGAIVGRTATLGTRAAAPVLGAVERVGESAIAPRVLSDLIPEEAVVKQSLTGAGMMAGAQQAMLNTQQRIQEKAGEGADPYLTAPEIAWAIVDGAFTGWTEKLGGFIAELAPLKPGGIGRVQDVLGDLPKAAVIGGSQEFVSTGTQSLQAGEAPKTGELAESFAIGATVVGTMQALNTPQAYMQRMRREVLEPGIAAANTVTRMNALAQGMEAAGKSKFKQRAPQRMLATAKAMLGDEAGLSVYFKTEDWVTYWTKQGLNPSEVATRLQGQSEQAGVIGVPVANLMADIAGTDHAAGVLDMAQDAPEGYSLAEARDILTELDKTRKEIDAEFEAQIKNPTLSNGVKDDSALLAEQVTQAIAGTKKGNEKFARSGGILFGQFYRTLADDYAKAGGKATPLELFNKYGPKILGPEAGKTDRGGYDEATRTLQLLAKGDASTIVHETSHHFLDVYSALASEEGAPAVFKENASSLNKWWSENAQQVADSYAKRTGEKVTGDEIKAIADAGLFLTAGKPVDTSALSAESKAYVASLPAEMQRELGSTIEHLKANPDPAGELGNLKAVVQAVEGRVAKGKRAAPIGESARRAMHEFFARGFEAYVTEGKAPSPALKRVFDSFARWISGVYGKLRGKNLENKLDVTLTDDARRFMSRILSTEDAMQAIEPHMAGLEEAAIKSGKMSEEEFAALAKATSGTRADIRADMLAKIAKAFTAEDIDRRESYRESIRDEVLAEVTDPGTAEGNAYALMNNPASKLSRKEAKAAFTPETVQKLEDRNLLANDGEALGAAAALHSFASEVEMVETLVSLRSLDEEVNARLRERENSKFGDPLAPEQMQALAEQQLYGTDRQKLVARELAIIDKLRKQTIEPSKAEAKTQAKRINSIDPAIIKAHEAAVVDKLPSYKLQPERWKRVAAKQNKAAIEAFGKGDYDAAYLAKQGELAALERAKLEEAAKDRFETDEKTVLRYRDNAKLRTELETGGSYIFIGPDGTKLYVDDKAQADLLAEQNPGSRVSAGGEALELVDSLLAKYDLEKLGRAGLDNREQVRKLLNDLGADGPSIPQSVVESLQKPNYMEVPASEIHALAVALDNIAANHAAKNETMLIKKGEKASNIRDQMVAQVEKVAPKKPPEGLLHDTITGPAARLFGTLVKMRTRIDRLDGGEFGVWWDNLLKPLQDRNVFARTVMSKQLADYNKLEELYPAIERTTTMVLPRAIPGTQLKLSHWERLMIGALWGSETGRQRVAQHLALLDPQADPQAVLDTLDKRDFDYIHGLWKQGDTLKPDVEDMYRRMGEKPPEWVESVPFQAGGRTFAGGYVHVSYKGEVEVSQDEAVRRIRGRQAVNLMTNNVVVDDGLVVAGNTAASARPGNGYTKTRAATVENKKLDLRPEVHIRHLNEVARDLAFSELIRDIDLILGRKGELGRAVSEKMGADFWKGLHADITAAIAGPSGANSPMEKVARGLRNNITSSSLAFSAWSILQQPLGFANAMADSAVGPGGFIKAVAKVYANPHEAYKNMVELSAFMKDRTNLVDANMHEVLAKTKTFNITEPISRYGFKGIGFAQMLLDMPTWYAAYESSLKEGRSAKDAVAKADQVVRDTMGSGEDTELTAMHRNQFTRLATLFATYPLTQLNQLTRAAQHAGMRKDPASIAKLVGVIFWASVVPMMLQTAAGALKGEKYEPDRDETWFEYLAMKQAKATVDMFPLARDFSGKMFGETNKVLPAAYRPVDAAINFGSSGEVKQLLKAMPLVPVAGIGSLPWSQVGKILDALDQPNLTPAEQAQRALLGAPFQPRR